MTYGRRHIETDLIGQVARAVAALKCWVSRHLARAAQSDEAARASLRRSRRARQRRRFRIERFVGLR